MFTIGQLLLVHWIHVQCFLSLPLTLPTQCSLLPWNVAKSSETSCCICQGMAEVCRLFSLAICLVGSQASLRKTSCRDSSYLQLQARSRWEYASNLRQYVVRSRQSEGHKQHAQISRFASRHQSMQAQVHTTQRSTKKNHNNEMFQTYIVSGKSPGKMSRKPPAHLSSKLKFKYHQRVPVL